MKNTITLWLLFMFCLFGTACSSGPALPDTAPVTGTVTYQGEPLEGANITFVPSGGRPASGATDSEGHFKMTTFDPGDGAIIGEHTVAITKTEPTSEKKDDPYAEQKSVIPEKYGSVKTSDLKAKVTAEGENNFEFNLSDG